ncbi:MAG: isoaspartyl peptidase/L-asparaginase [Thermoplasmata archaeon]|nr:isoaspartyl peptidase/L-asparaginase [Thermoplasmata archaeon]
MKPPVSIIVHGGAGKIPDKAVEDYINGTGIAAQKGFKLLKQGKSAVEAVEEAVRSMEEFPPLNCGVGSSLNRQRHIEMDAFLMRGNDLKSGAVAGVARILHPVSLAKRVMEDTPYLLIAGKGAEELAREFGFELLDENELITEDALRRWERVRKKMERQVSDTVGAVALDRYGNCASALSTGGMTYKLPGRIGDTPLVGCGGYANDIVGAAAATGIGEDLMKVVISKTALDHMKRRKDLHPKKAAQLAIDYLEERVNGREGGIIVMDMKGRVGWAFNAPRMGYAFIRRVGSRTFRGGGV